MDWNRFAAKVDLAPEGSMISEFGFWISDCIGASGGIGVGRCINGPQPLARLRRAKAREVLAVDIKPPFEQEQSTDKLLIKLPSQRKDRQKLIDWINSETEVDGYS